MYVVLFGRVHRDFGWRQRADQPAVTCIDRVVLQHVAEERSVSFDVLAVDGDVSAVNHAASVPSPGDGSPLNGKTVIPDKRRSGSWLVDFDRLRSTSK